MKEQQGMSKKFLFDGKKNKVVEEERQFHSKGYHPVMKQPQLIDLDSVWSVKNVVLDGGNKPVLSDKMNASTTYYSRHGQSKSNKDNTFMSGNELGSSQWNRKTESLNPQQRKFQSQNHDDPLDF